MCDNQSTFIIYNKCRICGTYREFQCQQTRAILIERTICQNSEIECKTNKCTLLAFINYNKYTRTNPLMHYAVVRIFNNQISRI